MEKSKLFRVLQGAAELEYFTGAELSQETGLTWDELKAYAECVWVADHLQKEGIFEYENGTSLSGDHIGDAPEERRYRITYPAMMHWREYQELTEARESSLSAQKSATTSIRIAIGAIAISSGLALIQLFLALHHA